MQITASEIREIIGTQIEHFPDRSLRWLFTFSQNVQGLLEILSDELADRIDFSRLSQLNRSFISDALREQESDLVFRVPFAGDSEGEELLIYILIEYQSQVDEAMDLRVLSYMTQIWLEQRREWAAKRIPKAERRLLPILPIVFYTGDQKWEMPLSLSALMDIPEILSEFVPRYRMLFLSVKEHLFRS